MLGGVPSVFTIHNLAYQGLFEPDWLPRLDLPWSLLEVEQLEFWGQLSFLKGGINASSMITTVSPTYAREIQTPEFGCGFDGVLRHRAANLVGILNGIDAEQWDPANDAAIPEPYNIDDLAGKRAAKAAVLTAYGLPTDAAALERPLVGHDLADGRSEGARHHLAARRQACRPRRVVCHPRHRRNPLPGHVAQSGGPLPLNDRCARRVRRIVGPSHRRRGRTCS